MGCEEQPTGAAWRLQVVSGRLGYRVLAALVFETYNL
jgi:hypothetical protein